MDLKQTTWTKRKTEMGCISKKRQEYLSIFEGNRGKEGGEGAQVDWRRRNCGGGGVTPTIV